MAFGPLLALIGIGALVLGAITFWSAVQNWLADLIQRTEAQFGDVAHTLQSVLVVIDRAVVNGKRVILATGRAVFQSESETPVTVEEVRSVAAADLPAEIAERLESGQPISYELSLGTVKHAPTYKLAVRRAD